MLVVSGQGQTFLQAKIACRQRKICWRIRVYTCSELITISPGILREYVS